MILSSSHLCLDQKQVPLPQKSEAAAGVWVGWWEVQSDPSVSEPFPPQEQRSPEGPGERILAQVQLLVQ